MECFVLIDHHLYRNSGLKSNPEYKRPCKECIICLGKVKERLYIIFGDVEEWNRNIGKVISWFSKNKFAGNEVPIYAYHHTYTTGVIRDKKPTVYKGTYHTESDRRDEFEDDLFG